MKRFETFTAIAAAMPEADIDTDVIFPARFLLLTEKQGLGRYAFHDRRFAADGSERADFVLNRPPWCDAAMLVAGANFGCGSSREQAPWALADRGIRCVIAPSFGDIFRANCWANGLLPIALAGGPLAQVLAEAEAGRPLTVNLMACTLTLADGREVAFEVPDAPRQALLSGTDEIDRIRRDHGADIAAFEQQHRLRMPWLFEPPNI